MFTVRARRLVALVFATGLTAGALLTGCSSSTGTAQAPKPAGTTQASASILVTAAHVNTPVVKEQTGAFANVMNNTGTDISLVGISVPASYAKSAGLHKMAMVDGKMAMVPVASIPIKAGAMLQLKSGGYHMMLMMPTCKTGDIVPITFRFDDGSTVTANAAVAMPVASPTPAMKM